MRSNFPDSLVRNIVETGTSNNNVYAGNYGVTSLAGSGSRIIYEHVNTTSFDFRSPSGAAPFTVPVGAAKVTNLDADKLDGRFYHNASNPPKKIKGFAVLSHSLPALHRDVLRILSTDWPAAAGPNLLLRY